MGQPVELSAEAPKIMDSVRDGRHLMLNDYGLVVIDQRPYPSISEVFPIANLPRPLRDERCVPVRLLGALVMNG